MWWQTPRGGSRFPTNNLYEEITNITSVLHCVKNMQMWQGTFKYTTLHCSRWRKTLLGLEILALNYKSSSISCVVNWKFTMTRYKTYNTMADKSDKRESGANLHNFHKVLTHYSEEHKYFTLLWSVWLWCWCNPSWWSHPTADLSWRSTWTPNFPPNPTA
jgi:hypothetical protein